MEMRPDQTPRAVSFVFVVAGLLAIALGLGAMLYIALAAAHAFADPAARKLLTRLAWLALTLLCLTAVMLIWVILRHIRYRLRAAPPLKRSQYVNAWELAGQRLKLDDGDDGPADDEDGEKEDEPDPEEPRP